MLKAEERECVLLCTQGVGLLLLTQPFCLTPFLIRLPIGWPHPLCQGQLSPSRALRLGIVEGKGEEGGWSATQEKREAEESWRWP